MILKGLSHAIDFENVDKNLQIYALGNNRAANTVCVALPELIVFLSFAQFAQEKV
jgi:hypothetical protein